MKDDRYSDFDHFFLKMLKRLYIETFPHFLVLSISENVETSVYRNDLGEIVLGRNVVTIL